MGNPAADTDVQLGGLTTWKRIEWKQDPKVCLSGNTSPLLANCCLNCVLWRKLGAFESRVSERRFLPFSFIVL